MIGGQFPRMSWRKNPGGEIRSPEEAIEIARRHGVVIPEDVHLSFDSSDDLGPNRTAWGPRVDKETGEIVRWDDLVHDRTGKVPYRIWSGVLDSDEAIVAVLGHEMYENNELRLLMREEEISIDEYIGMTCPGNPGNIHDEAWDVSDKLVERMRSNEKP